MIIPKTLANDIITTSYNYLGREFCWSTFNCVHFVIEVYSKVGIDFPLLIRNEIPPLDFHLDVEEFEKMPIGHSVFFKRKMSWVRYRSWTHVAIIVEKDKLIHCTRNLGTGVVITTKSEFLEAYDLAPHK